MSLSMIAFAGVFTSFTLVLIRDGLHLRRMRSRAISVRNHITLAMNDSRISVRLAEPEPDSSPVYALITRCTNTDSGAQGAHLVLKLTETHADRQCVECDHEWKEKRT